MGDRPKYTNPDDMQALIHLYFVDCKKNFEADKNGWGEPKDTITEDLFPNVTGLALALDMTREGLINYEAKDEFTDTVKRAKQRVESYTVQRLFMNNPTGSIFNLKNNFNWKDKQEVEHSGDIGNNGGICRASEILEGFRSKGQNDPDEGTVQE